jgi:hypothetical protein
MDAAVPVVHCDDHVIFASNVRAANPGVIQAQNSITDTATEFGAPGSTLL